MCANLRSMPCTKLPRFASSIWIICVLSAHKAPQTYNVFHSILSAVGTTSCPSITWHPERWSGPATSAPRVLDVHHSILFAVGTASCPSITWHPKNRLGSAAPAFGALDVHHPILFAVGTASCPSITWHPERRYGPATSAFGVLDVHHPILFAVGAASRPSVAWHPERWSGPATTAFGALDVHHPMLFTLGTASCPSITWHPERRSGSATPAFGVLYVHHPILFAVGTASCPSITWHPERRYGPATTAFGVLDVHHPMLFTLGTASCPSITRHPERRLGSATPAFGVPEVDHTIPFADGTARWSCIMLKSKRRVEHTSTHTGAKPPCQCANVRLSVRRASIGKEAAGRAALAVVALSSQNMREQQPACSPAICNQHQKQQLIDPLGGSKNEASILLWLRFGKQVVLGHLSHSPLHCFRTLPSTSPAKRRRPCTGHAWHAIGLHCPGACARKTSSKTWGPDGSGQFPKQGTAFWNLLGRTNPRPHRKTAACRMEGHTCPLRAWARAARRRPRKAMAPAAIRTLGRVNPQKET